ncbi:hypothetical protein ACT7DZ_16110 [Bacillus cereus]
MIGLYEPVAARPEEILPGTSTLFNIALTLKSVSTEVITPIVTVTKNVPLFGNEISPLDCVIVHEGEAF